MSEADRTPAVRQTREEVRRTREEVRRTQAVHRTREEERPRPVRPVLRVR